MSVGWYNIKALKSQITSRISRPSRSGLRPCNPTIWHRGLSTVGESPAAVLNNANLRRSALGKPKGYVHNAQYTLERHSLSGLPLLITEAAAAAAAPPTSSYDPKLHRGKSSTFTVLGVESSCDDTGVAIVRSDGVVLSNIVYSQYAVHERFGGVVPSLAKAAHAENIDKAIKEALLHAGMTSVDDVDAIAATRGPGLEICLRVGFSKAQDMAREFKKPFVTVHHLEAHCLMARLAGAQVHSIDTGSPARTPLPLPAVPAVAKADTTLTAHPHFTPQVAYPFLALLVSGGHTSLLVCRGLGDYELLGGTLDDSLGESFDKAARLLGLRMLGSSSGGAAVEAAAASSRLAAAALNTRRAAQAVLARLAVEQSAGIDSPPLVGDEKDAVREFRRRSAADSCAMFKMKVPLRDKRNCDFSFSGLKNSFRMAVLRARGAAVAAAAVSDPNSGPGIGIGAGIGTNAPSQGMQEVSADDVVALPAAAAADLCYAFQDVAFAHLEDRVERALDHLAAAQSLQLKLPERTDDAVRSCTALVVVGGVAANKQLRQRLLDLLAARAVTEGRGQPPLPLIFPPVQLCTDNGVMAAWTGIEKLVLGISDSHEKLEVIARWPLGSQRSISSSSSSSTPAP